MILGDVKKTPTGKTVLRGNAVKETDMNTRNHNSRQNKAYATQFGHVPGGLECELRNQSAWVWIPAPLTCCATSDSSLTLVGPQFPQM